MWLEKVGGARKIFRAGVFCVVIGLALAGTEVWLEHTCEAEKALVPRIYYSHNTAVRVLNFDRMLKTQGGIDVLFIGSSVVQTDIRPQIFDDTIRRRVGSNISSFNAGLSGAHPNTVFLYLKHKWLNDARPQMVIQGVRLAELKAKTTAEKWQLERFRSNGIERKWLSQSPVDHVQASLMAKTKLLQYPGLFIEILNAISDDRPLETLLTDRFSQDDGRGYKENRTSLTTRKKRKQKIKGQDPYGYRVSREEMKWGLSYLVLSAEICAQRGVDFAVMNVPEHPHKYQKRGGEDLYREFVDVLKAHADANGHHFLDVTDRNVRWLKSDKEFTDYHHMTDVGAQRFTTAVADEVLMMYGGAIGAMVDRRVDRSQFGTMLSADNQR